MYRLKPAQSVSRPETARGPHQAPLWLAPALVAEPRAFQQTVAMRMLAGCLAIPRVLLILIWVLTDYLDTVFTGQLTWVVLGFLFMPMTLLAYGLVAHFQGAVEGYWLGPVIAAALYDLGLIGRLIPGRGGKDD